jgi:tetratricopeptide (TPR) repeat protein
MDSEVTQSDKFYSLLAWLEVNKKRVIWGAAIVAVASLTVFLIVRNRGQRENSASEALSEIKAPLTPDALMPSGMAEAYLKVADNYQNTQAGARARLLGATTLYTLNDYQRALDQFQQFLRDNPESTWLPQASLGVAVCLDSLKRTQEAIAKYDELIKRYANNPEAIRARMQLARLYEEQGKPDLALKLYEDIVKLDRFSSQGSMASLRAEDLRNKYPSLTATNVPVAMMTNQVSALATNLQTNLPKPVVTNLAPANPPKTDKP